MGMLANDRNYNKRGGYDNRRNNFNNEYGEKSSYRTEFGARKKEKYNFNKFGDKPYETELDRRQNLYYEQQEAKNIRYRKPVNDTFSKSIIDDIIRLHKPVSGYLLKLLFDEYQRDKYESDQYTMFYTSYVLGSNNSGSSPHCKISNNNLYLLFINTWGDIVPRKICKEFDLVNPVMTVLNKTVVEPDPDHDEFIKRVAAMLHDKAPDDWSVEMDGNIHNWDGPIHKKYLMVVESILSYVNDNMGNNDTEEKEEE